MKVYLPRAEGEMRESSHETQKEIPGGTELILVVEDEASVRNMLVRILTDHGYSVLEAANGEEALRLIENSDGVFDLLVTDVIMPRMGGRELMEKLHMVFPGHKVLFISGYTDNSIVHHGILEEGIEFLQKPFTPSAILRKIRTVLDKND